MTFVKRTKKEKGKTQMNKLMITVACGFVLAQSAAFAQALMAT